MRVRRKEKRYRRKMEKKIRVKDNSAGRRGQEKGVK